MYSIILKARALLLTAVFLTIAAGFLAPMALADNHGPLQPTDAPTALPTYSGVDESIEAFLCTPKGQGTDLLDCVGRLYRFGISAGAIALIFFLVLAGYLYITSGEAGKGKAKNILLSAVTGMGILLGSFVLLNFINPSLTQIRTIQPPIFDVGKLPDCEAIGFSSRCIIRTGPGAGQVSTGSGTPTTANEAQYRDLILRHASANGLEYCALSAKIRQESSFIYNNVSNGPPNRVNPDHPDKKFYGLPFTRGYTATAPKGHGIGLSQVFIYGPPAEWRSKEWPDSGTPARGGAPFGFNRPLTVSDLINPDTSIKAGAFYFGSLMRRHNNNLYNAYRAYTGGHEGSALRRMMGFYDECKLASR